MLTDEQAWAFAEEWVAAWNAHDLHRILEHYTADIEICTPMAALLIPESKGIITGKAALHAYWTTGLERIPDLFFRILDVLTGVDMLTIYYLNTATGRKSAETLMLDTGGKVFRSYVCYS